MSEIYDYDHLSAAELAAIIRPQMIGTEEHALDALTALQSQAEFPRYAALRAALRDAQREGDEWKVKSERLQVALDAAMQYVAPKDRDWIDALAAGKNA